MVVVCITIPCWNLISGYPCFRGIHCLHLQACGHFNPQDEVNMFFKKVVPTYRITLRSHNSHAHNMNFHLREIPEPYKNISIILTEVLHSFPRSFQVNVGIT
jgi:hypothetical protein